MASVHSFTPFNRRDKSGMKLVLCHTSGFTFQLHFSSSFHIFNRSPHFTLPILDERGTKIPCIPSRTSPPALPFHLLRSFVFFTSLTGPTES